MKNKLYYVANGQKETIINSIKENENIFIAEINGLNIKTSSEYLEIIRKVFNFPKPLENYKLNYDGYLDWIRDLSWIDTQEFVLIIRNFSLFLKDDLTTKNEIIDDFKEIILPWWETEVEQCVVGGKAKPFNIYLID